MTDAQFDVDLAVIGAGSGGVRAARIAAGYGARVLVAEEYRPGGTCVIRGCVPKKLYVMAAAYRDALTEMQGFGWRVGEAQHDWRALVAAKEREITRLSDLYVRGVQGAGGKVVNARAVVTGPHTIRLAGEAREVRAKHILVATGATPWRPDDLPGIEHTVTSDTIFDLPVFPRRIVIAGGGYIAAEFASVFSGLGAEVTLVYRGQQILRGFDAEARAHVQAELERRGIRFVLNTIFEAVEPTGTGYRVHLRNGETLETDCVFMAVGRTPNTKGLGLETAGVELGHHGAVMVDRYGQTNIPSIWAVGDVTDRLNLTPVAIREGHAFADTVFGNKPAVPDHALAPTAIFSLPPLACVGLTEEQARAEHPNGIDVYKAAFRPMRHTLSGRETRTFMKLLVDPVSGRVLGLHMVGEDAPEIVQMAAIAVRMGATKADFDATLALHPTAAEEFVLMRTKS